MLAGDTVRYTGSRPTVIEKFAGKAGKIIGFDQNYGLYEVETVGGIVGLPSNVLIKSTHEDSVLDEMKKIRELLEGMVTTPKSTKVEEDKLFEWKEVQNLELGDRIWWESEYHAVKELRIYSGTVWNIAEGNHPGTMVDVTLSSGNGWTHNATLPFVKGALVRVDKLSN